MHRNCTLAEIESGRLPDVRMRDITAAEVGVTRWRTNAGRHDCTYALYLSKLNRQLQPRSQKALSSALASGSAVTARCCSRSEIFARSPSQSTLLVASA